MVWATQISLSIGIVSASISMIIGTLIGAISGYYGGRIDTILMRISETLLAIPSFFLVLVIVSMFGAGIFRIMFVIGFTIWPATARLIRAEFLRLREKEFVSAVKTIGASDFHIIIREILPNAIHVAIVTTTMRVANAILMESTLSFLGLGDPLNISWGLLLNQALDIYKRSWWLAIYPGFAISLTVLAFNLIGDGLNDAFNPYLKEK
jgi:peptide/nickel transport system permease protein